MNTLIENVYTMFKAEIEEYNRLRAEKIELAYIGECQNYHVFCGDIDRLFLADEKGGFQVYFDINAPKLEDMEAAQCIAYYPKKIKEFSFKKLIKWLYKRNTLVKNIKWNNLQAIKYIQKCTYKIKPLERDFLIDLKTGKKCGTLIGCGPAATYMTETYKYDDKPHILVKYKEQYFRFYLPDVKPKTQKEMVIVPHEAFKDEFYLEMIKDIKQSTMHYISQKSADGHLNYYELLLMYRAFNPPIEVPPVSKEPKSIFPKFGIIYAEYPVIKYSQAHNLNPYAILSQMFDKGYIDDKGRVYHEKSEDFMKDFSYLVETKA